MNQAEGDRPDPESIPPVLWEVDFPFEVRLLDSGHWQLCRCYEFEGAFFVHDSVIFPDQLALVWASYTMPGSSIAWTVGACHVVLKEPVAEEFAGAIQDLIGSGRGRVRKVYL